VLTAYENLKLHALLYDVPLAEINVRIDRVLALVDLDKRKNDILRTFSGGMRRRMEIARGLLHEPQVFFLDEPTLGLDPQTRDHIWAYIRGLAEKNRMTIVLTTHYMEEAEKLCGRVAIIDRGRIVALDTPKSLIGTVGGDIVRLRGDLKVPELERLPFVREVKKADAGWQLAVENAARNLPELLRAAGAVESVEVHSPDLNDVFLHYTGRQMREEEGDAMDFLSDMTRIRESK
jgi:ABC-2 type transport system ATP-binding protein